MHCGKENEKYCLNLDWFFFCGWKRIFYFVDFWRHISRVQTPLENKNNKFCDRWGSKNLLFCATSFMNGPLENFLSRGGVDPLIPLNTCSLQTKMLPKNRRKVKVTPNLHTPKLTHIHHSPFIKKINFMSKIKAE